ncbi:MAG: hypothetical protein AB1894_19480 [Chloroflexota bacterium]
MTQTYAELRKRHNELLGLQRQPPQDFTSQVKAFIEELKASGRDVYASQERDQLRGFLRYWASALYEIDRSQGFQVVDLDVYAGPPQPSPETLSSRLVWLSILGFLGIVAMLVAIIVYWIVQESEMRALRAELLSTSAARQTQIMNLVYQTKTALANTPTATASPTLSPTPLEPAFSPTPSATPVETTPPAQASPSAPVAVPIGPAVTLENPKNGQEILPEVEFSGSYVNMRPGWSIHVVLQPVSAGGKSYLLADFFTVPDGMTEGEWALRANLYQQFDVSKQETYIVSLVVANNDALRQELQRLAKSGFDQPPGDAIVFTENPVTVRQNAYRVIDEYRLLYTSWSLSEKTQEIFTANLQGGDIHRLTSDSKYRKYYPSLSADGRQIAYAAWITNPDNTNEKIYSLWVMDSSGTNQRIVLVEPGMMYEQPVWSPDGRYLAYAAKQQQESTWDVYLLDVSSGLAPEDAAGVILNGSLLSEGEWIDNRYPWWVSGEEIIYSQRTKNSIALSRVNIRTQQSQDLPQFSGSIQPSVSWDGKLLAAVLLDRQTSAPTVYVGEIRGDHFQPLTRPEDTLSWPHWGPDNQSLYCQKMSEIWIVKLDGSKPRILELGKDYYFQPFVGLMKAFLPVAP